jgi:hypothetical protein
MRYATVLRVDPLDTPRPYSCPEDPAVIQPSDDATPPPACHLCDEMRRSCNKNAPKIVVWKDMVSATFDGNSAR